jgi:protocatechuate 3,4-dioxygenase beta subunit
MVDVTGEYVRANMTETELGVPLILDTQVIDMATCEPVTTAMVEIWHCNSTGVYSGIVASGNGDSSVSQAFSHAIEDGNTNPSRTPPTSTRHSCVRFSQPTPKA